MDSVLHVIFGAGQVGSTLADILASQGKRFRLVKRHPSEYPSQVELILGDATDAAFCHQASAGAAVIYHCMNPEYSTNIWDDVLPKYMDNLIAAAGNIGARLVVLDNLYMLGNPNGKPLNENTLSNPCSKKGEIRAAVAERLFAAHRQGTVSAVCGRASDFYGPRGKLSYFGDYFWKPVLAGKTAVFPINIDVTHTYHYIPGVAQGLAALGAADESALGRAWMLPCQPAVTTRELAQRLEQHLGQHIKMRVIPKWLLKPIEYFMPMVSELNEMAYQWEVPFIVDDSLFRAQFDVRPVAEDEAARMTVDWARQAYSS